MHDKLMMYLFSQIIFQISKCLTSLTHPVPTIIGSPLPENPVLTQIDTTVWLTSTLGRDGHARIQYGWKRVSDKHTESPIFFFIKFKINMIYTCININSAETTKTISTIDLVNMLLVIIFGNFLCSLKFIFFYKIIHKNAQKNFRQMPGI